MRKAIYYSMILALVLLGSTLGSAPALAHAERQVGQHMTLVDENNNIIDLTGLQVHNGDEFICPDNSRYKVVEVVGNTARCVYQGQEKMPAASFDKKKQAWVFEDAVIPVVNGRTPTVAVYHTHSDESYLPGDGTASINGNGGIYDVGDTFVSELKRKGFNVVYSKNNHNPHDINAYSRSRRTAASLLRQNPDVVIDVHRDAVPASQYQAQVKGQEVTKVKLVVGRTNPNMKTNLEFAKRVKAAMDQNAPGLSNGIFIGKGDFNQDLSPRSILIEVGSHTNSKTDAKQGAAIFADTLPSILGTSGATTQGPAAKPLTRDNQGAGTAILIILVVVAAAAGGYYLLNRGTNIR